MKPPNGPRFDSDFSRRFVPVLLAAINVGCQIIEVAREPFVFSPVPDILLSISLDKRYAS